MASIAREYGVSRAAVSGKLKRAGYDPIAEIRKEIDIDQVSCMYAENMTVAEIAEEIGVNASRLLKVMQRHGVQLRRPGSRVPPKKRDDEEAFVTLYEQGLSPRAISIELDAHEQTVRRILKRHGVFDSTRDRKVIPQQTQEEMVRAIDKGRTLKDVAEEFGVMPATVKAAVMRRDAA